MFILEIQKHNLVMSPSNILLMALDLPPWALKTIASAYVGSCGRAAKMLEGDIASLLGLG
jgi:hypothetical protein